MMLRMRRRVMRKLRSIYLINRPEGFLGENVPKGRVVAIWNIVTKYLLKRTYAFVKNPSGRFYTC